MVKILFVGDVSGQPGRRAVSKLLGALRSSYDAQLVVVNGENAAGGLGITQPTAHALFDAGADVITLGNHTFAKRDVASYIDSEPRIIRPANYPPGVPGRGWGIFEASSGEQVGVTNLLGRVFMDPVDCPFRGVDAVLAEMVGVPIVLVDIHAEATSEKIAMGWYLDGRVSAVLGTHTHVQTSDEGILPSGTAYITDVGFTGVHDSVLGLNKEKVIERFLKQIPGKFELAVGEATLQGVVVTADPETGRAVSIERVNVMESSVS